MGGHRIGQWLDAHQFAADAGVAWGGGLALGLLVLFFGGTSTEVAVTVLLCAPLAWRRTAPVWSALVVYILALGSLLSGVSFVVGDVAVTIALYSVSAFASIRWSYLGLAGALVGSSALALWSNSGTLASFLAVFAVAAGISISAWALGLVRKSRREAMTEMRSRNELLEREESRQAQLAVELERTRIAREMHDIVAHSLSVIIAQADGGRYAATADPQAGIRSLSTIAETGRAALSDMRRILGVLRTPADSAVTSPQPATTDIDQLVEQMRDTGMRISYGVIGVPRHLPPGMGLTIFRICQESLTNILKHAGPDPEVTVMTYWTPTAVELDIGDDGRGAAATMDSDGVGQGLLGMRERAAMFGGDISAGPKPGGGFKVHATIPTPTVHDTRGTL